MGEGGKEWNGQREEGSSSMFDIIPERGRGRGGKKLMGGREGVSSA